MGQASEFSLSVEEYDINELEADITAPSGKAESCLLKKLPNGHLGNNTRTCQPVDHNNTKHLRYLSGLCSSLDNRLCVESNCEKPRIV